MVSGPRPRREPKQSTASKPFERSGKPANEMENRCGDTRSHQEKIRGAEHACYRESSYGNLGRYRVIASLYRQTAAFRPLHKVGLAWRRPKGGSISLWRSSRLISNPVIVLLSQKVAAVAAENQIIEEIQ